ncbi:MAG: hypothetical protein VX938_00175, partial [Myxococcota bacterium]|nr:hypothetical protein [Myxococcota bacterium]
QDPDGALRGWVSDDGGVNFTERVMPDTGPVEAARLGGVDLDGTWWIWVGDALHALDDGVSMIEERRFEEGPCPLSTGPQGEVWVAGGAEGLWRRTPDGSWNRMLPDTTTAVDVTTGTCWSGHPAESPGAPMVRWSNDGGASWSIPLLAPDTWGFSAGCETASAQVCAADLESAWPVSEDDPEDDPPTAESESGCTAASDATSTGWLSGSLFLFALMFLAFRTVPS